MTKYEKMEILEKRELIVAHARVIMLLNSGLVGLGEIEERGERIAQLARQLAGTSNE